MTNQKLYDAACQAANDLFIDTSVLKEETAKNLNALIAEIEIMIEALEIPAR